MASDADAIVHNRYSVALLLTDLLFLSPIRNHKETAVIHIKDSRHFAYIKVKIFYQLERSHSFVGKRKEPPGLGFCSRKKSLLLFLCEFPYEELVTALKTTRLTFFLSKK